MPVCLARLSQLPNYILRMGEFPGTRSADDDRPRCRWAIGPWMVPYHDTEWGIPVHGDPRHFELLALEGAQAGLSWLTVLKRRPGYRRAFAGFDPSVVARYTDRQIDMLMDNPDIIRHRQKIESVVGNARAFLRIQEEAGSFDAYIWEFVGGKPIVNRWTAPEDIPGSTPLSASISADLRRRGFRFTGPTICYSYMQATGMVIDHLLGCFRHPTAGT